MPVYPVGWKPPLLDGDYPHMARHDARIWERFLLRNGSQFSRVAYDVALGGVRFQPDEGEEAQALGFHYSTALKVDAVAERGPVCWIIEVKPDAGVSAIGAALCYLELAQVDRFTELELVPVVVTDRTSQDIRYCAEQLGVLIVEAPDV